MEDLFNLVTAVVITQMAVIVAMVETDRACRHEPSYMIWSRRYGFGLAAATMVYASLSHDWLGAFVLAVSTCSIILTINIMSIRARNRPPLQGYRSISKAHAFWKRYP